MFTVLKLSLTLPELVFVIWLVAWLIRSVRHRAQTADQRKLSAD